MRVKTPSDALTKGCNMATKYGYKEAVAKLVKQHEEAVWEDDPKFDKARKYHDWRNYVPQEIQKVWPDLGLEARVMVYIAAEHQAQSENWD
jgi:hypothetical protein